MDKSFDIDAYFDGCCGIIRSDEPKQRVVIAAHGDFADYLRTLPLHSSQRELGADGGRTLFEYGIKPTFDFYQLALAQADQMEVVSPQRVQDEMKRFAENILSYYKK